MLQQRPMFNDSVAHAESIAVSGWPGAGEKVCKNCKLSQPLGNFMRHAFAKDGYNSWCKTCLSAASIAAKANPKPKRRKPAKKRRSASKRRATASPRRAAPATSPAPRNTAKTAPQAAPALRIIHASQLDDLSTQWLVYQTIPAASLVCLAGAPGVGKSFLSLDAAAATSLEHPVIYVLAEGSAGFKARLDAWEALNGQPVGNLHILPTAINLLDNAAVDAFIDAITPIAPKLVVIDTLARCYPGNENNSGSMGRFVMNIARIQDTFGASVLVIHHLSRAGHERGSTALSAAMDVMLTLTENEDDGGLLLKSTKMKDYQPIEQRLRLTTIRLASGRTSCAVEYGDNDGDYS